ncbi:21209_t:CDS:1, partial [Entrophospora sp. SA101]
GTRAVTLMVSGFIISYIITFWIHRFRDFLGRKYHNMDRNQQIAHDNEMEQSAHS